jgi:threonine dehydratase
VYVKLESVQHSNSFKMRGAFNAGLRVLENAVDRSRLPRLVTASAGNHGRALAHVAKELGLEAIVFTPKGAPETKKKAIRWYGVDLRDDAPDYDSAEEAARRFSKEEGALYISAYNHQDVIAGAGTIGFEILDALPAFDVLVVPIGGGGLASGLGISLKAAAPDVRITGVEAAASTPFAASTKAGHITRIDAKASLADGLTGNLEPESITFDIVRRVVDELTAVTEAEIASAIRLLSEEEHLIAEGAGAVATAAVLSRDIVRTGETAVVMITGSNIDSAVLARVSSGDRG